MCRILLGTRSAGPERESAETRPLRQIFRNDMNWLYIVVDLLVVLFLLIWARTGWRRGLVVELATLVGLLLGIFLAFRFSPLLSERLGWTRNDLMDSAIWFAIIFIAVYILAQVIGEWLSGKARRIRLGVLDKILGLALSIIEGLCFISAVGYSLSLFPQGANLVASTYLLRFITQVGAGFFARMFGG